LQPAADPGGEHAGNYAEQQYKRLEYATPEEPEDGAKDQ